MDNILPTRRRNARPDAEPPAPGTDGATERAIVATILESPSEALARPALRWLVENSPRSMGDPLCGLAAAEVHRQGPGANLISAIRGLDGQIDEQGKRYLLALANEALPVDLAEADAARLVESRRPEQLAKALQEAAGQLEAIPKRWKQIIEVATETLQSLAVEGPSHGRWTTLCEDGATILSETVPPPVEVIRGLLPERAKFMLGSGSKSFKTWLTLDMALSIAGGEQFLERATEPRRVVYCNFELKPETFKRRAQILCKRKGIAVEPGWFHHLPLRGLLAGMRVSQVVDSILEVIAHCHAEVVVIDPLYKLNLEGEENNSRDQTLLFNELDRLITVGKVTLILNDHFSKGNQSEKDPLDAIRGSSAKGGDVDAAMVLRRHEVADCFRVDIVHRELPPVEPFTIGWNFPLMEVRHDLDPDKMKKVAGGRRAEHDPLDLCRAILETDEQHPVTISQWADLAGIPRRTLGNYTETLRRQGLVGTVGEGTRARQFITEKGRLQCTQTSSTQ